MEFPAQRSRATLPWTEVRMQRGRWALAVSAIAIGVWACSSDVATTIGDAMVDAGESLSDAGGELRDASDDAAAAQVTAECVQDGSFWFAEATIDVDPASVRSVTAILCGLEGAGAEDGFPCSAAVPAFSATRVRVLCGNGDPATSGYVYRDVRFYIE
jgi:hypothetical protein